MVSYELIRPVVLFGRSAAERAQQTGISRRTIYRKASRFDALGMAGDEGAIWLYGANLTVHFAEERLAQD